MSEQPDNRPGDVWITVNSSGEAPAKYYANTSNVVLPYGPSGPAVLEVKFNLTAYVRDVIAEAVK